MQQHWPTNRVDVTVFLTKSSGWSIILLCRSCCTKQSFYRNVQTTALPFSLQDTQIIGMVLSLSSLGSQFEFSPEASWRNLKSFLFSTELLALPNTYTHSFFSITTSNKELPHHILLLWNHTHSLLTTHTHKSRGAHSCGVALKRDGNMESKRWDDERKPKVKRQFVFLLSHAFQKTWPGFFNVSLSVFFFFSPVHLLQLGGWIWFRCLWPWFGLGVSVCVLYFPFASNYLEKIWNTPTDGNVYLHGNLQSWKYKANQLHHIFVDSFK